MESKIQIFNYNASVLLTEIVVEDAYIYEKINDKYTFDFTCYEQPGTNYFNQHSLIGADDDYFRIASVNISPIDGKYEVSCEHVGYELNLITPEEEEEDEEDLHYEGYVWQIIREILQGTRFKWVASDDIPNRFNFVTRSKGRRTRILEFCIATGLEVHWRKFDVAIQRRRGRDNGLEIELGENLRDLKINKIFNINGSVEQSFDIDFIDLNKLKDANGAPLKPFEFHMGDTVHLKYKNQTHIQRGVAVGYNPFQRALPTIELESPSRDIVEVIASSDGTAIGRANGGDGIGGKFAHYRYRSSYDEYMYLRTNDTTGRWGDIPYVTENNMTDFKFEIGKLTLKPNAEVKIIIDSTVEIESLKLYDENSYGGGDLLNKGGKVYEVNPDSIFGDVFIADITASALNSFHESHYISNNYGYIYSVAYIKNTVKILDRDETRYRYYHVLDTEKGNITVHRYRLQDELKRLIADVPNPEDVDEYYLINVAFQNIYGEFARHYRDYIVIDTYYEEVSLDATVREFRDMPLSIGISINYWDIGDYDILSVHLVDRMDIEIIGTGFEFTPDENHNHIPIGEMDVDFDDLPFIKK